MNIKYGSPTNSQEINDKFNAEFNKINKLYEELETMKKELKEQQTINYVNNVFANNQIEHLLSENKELKENLNNQNSFNQSKHILAEDMTGNILTSQYDKVYSTGSIKPKNIIPISYISTSEQNFIPDNLKITIEDNFKKQFYVETDPKKIIDGDLNSFWHREYHFNKNSEIENIVLDINIDMPYADIYDFNYITINPYPYGNIDILSLEYFDGVQWKNLNVNEIKSKNLVINIKQDKIQKISLKIRQCNYIIINNQKIFYLGLNNLFVGKYFAENNTTEFTYDFTIKNNTILNEIVPIFLSNQQNENISMSNIRIGKLKEHDIVEFIDTEFPLYLESDTKIRIFVTLNKTDLIPFLKKIIINFSKSI